VKFVKRPVVVEAVQFKAADVSTHEHVNFGCPCDKNAACSKCGRFWIETLEGTMFVSEDDWIITGVKGEHYPCKPDIFAETYSPVVTAKPTRIER